MLSLVKRKFKYWNMRSCLKCGCRETRDTEHIFVTESVVGEYSIVCRNCGTTMNHWAYGSVYEPETKIGYFVFWLRVYSPFAKISYMWSAWKLKKELKKYRLNPKRNRIGNNLTNRHKQ